MESSERERETKIKRERGKSERKTEWLIHTDKEMELMRMRDRGTERQREKTENVKKAHIERRAQG
jgi:hypothetical protein